MRNLRAALMAFSLGVVGAANAATVTYTFESPDFVAGQTTPLLNRPPQIGTTAFRADFTSAPSANGLTIGVLGSSPMFSGQILYDPFPPAGADTLSISLNTPVTSVQVDFALFAPGHLQLSSPVGSVSAPVTSGQSGTLTFSSPTSFMHFDLQGFDPSNQPTQLAIDNLTLTLAPEPSAFGLLLCASGMALLRRRQSST